MPHIIALTIIDLRKLFTCVCTFYPLRNHQYIIIRKGYYKPEHKVAYGFHFYYLLFLKLRAAPIPMPTAIHSGSLVAANSPAPMATPTAISVPAFQEDLGFLFITSPNLKYYKS